jgi:hypothetical protein
VTPPLRRRLWRSLWRCCRACNGSSIWRSELLLLLRRRL